MGSGSGAESSIKIGFYSVVGALAGGVTGSWASTAFGESAAFDFVSTFLIFGVGIFLGLMAGTAFHGSIKRRFSMKAAKRVELTGRIGIASIGFLITGGLGTLLVAVWSDGEFPFLGVLELIMILCIYLLGFLVAFISLYPYLIEDENR